MFALVVILSIMTPSGVEKHRFVIDQGLTADECIERQAKADPAIVLADGFVIVSSGVACDKESSK